MKHFTELKFLGHQRNVEIISAAELEDIDAGALFCYVEERQEYSLVILNHEVNHPFPRIY